MKTVPELVQLIQKNDEKSFTELVERFKPLLISVSCKDGTFDDDCYQECLISLYFALQSFKFLS